MSVIQADGCVLSADSRGRSDLHEEAPRMASTSSRRTPAQSATEQDNAVRRVGDAERDHRQHVPARPGHPGQPGQEDRRCPVRDE